MRNSAIAASGLRKAYKDRIVLDGIDLDVAERERLVSAIERAAGEDTGKGRREV